MIRKFLKKEKYGYQYDKTCGIYKFNSIDIDGHYAYCISHNFIYDVKEETRKLYQGLPCHYTDKRYVDSNLNFYGCTRIRWTRDKDQDIKHYINICESIRNVPTDFVFNSSYYIKNSKQDIEFKYKQKSRLKFDPQYQINKEEYMLNFSNDDKMNELISLLRKNNFLVAVYKNSNYLKNMLNTAIDLTGGETIPSEEEGDIAIAYGHGLKIGFASNDSLLYGYGNSKNKILYDKYDEFDKWSKCYEIDKSDDNNIILNNLLNIK